MTQLDKFKKIHKEFKKSFSYKADWENFHEIENWSPLLYQNGKLIGDCDSWAMNMFLKMHADNICIAVGEIKNIGKHAIAMLSYKDDWYVSDCNFDAVVSFSSYTRSKGSMEIEKHSKLNGKLNDDWIIFN